MTDGRNERVNLTTWTGIAIKVVIRSYFRPEVYKLYQFPLPSIAKSKNLFIIIRNLLFLEINILANVGLMVARGLQHWASIIPALVHQYI